MLIGLTIPVPSSWVLPILIGAMVLWAVGSIAGHYLRSKEKRQLQEQLHQTHPDTVAAPPQQSPNNATAEEGQKRNRAIAGKTVLVISSGGYVGLVASFRPPVVLVVLTLWVFVVLDSVVRTATLRRITIGLGYALPGLMLLTWPFIGGPSLSLLLILGMFVGATLLASAKLPKDVQPAAPTQPAMQQYMFVQPPLPGSLPPANWYPDPSGLPVLRYWDGMRWTDHQQPMPAPSGPAQ